MRDEAVKLLLIEDNPGDVRLVQAALAGAGHGDFHVEVAGSLAEALARLERGGVDVALVDLQLPDSRGLPTFRVLAEKAPRTPIVILTGHDEESRATEALQEGAQDYLVKGETPPELLERAIAYAIGRKRAEDALRRARDELEQRVNERTAELSRTNAELTREINERKRAEQKALEASRLKDEFLATVSHELRTPLTPILGWAQLLQQGHVEWARAKRALETIEHNAKLLTGIVDDLLDVSRIITGKLPLDITTVDLGPLLEQVADALHLAAEAKSITLKLKLDSNAYPVAGDANRLRQVVWNLLGNAIKFTPPGGRVVARLGLSGGQVRITVTDTGRGISPDFLPFVFDRFRQADGGITRSQGGLGLGLAIVRHLVELPGGTVSASSAGEGQGSTFTVELPPATYRPSAIKTRPQVSTPALAVQVKGLKVLVVDDDSDTCQLVEVVLGEQKIEVRSASASQAALALLETFSPDVLLLDLALPGDDGFVLLRKIRSSRPALAQIPAGALTAHAGGDDRARALASGFQLHLPKPIEAGQIVAAVVELAGLRPPPATP